MRPQCSSVPPRTCESVSWPRCAAASRRTTHPYRSPTGRSRISHAIARAGSTPSCADNPATAAPRASCSTATRKARALRSSTSAEPRGACACCPPPREGGPPPLVSRQPRDGGPESILLDGDKEGEGLAFFDLGGAEHSPDHRLIAWSADTKGSEYFAIRVRDLDT